VTQAGPPIRALLVDDHAIVREGLRLILRRQHDIEVVGEAGTLQEALGFVEPVDVIVADLVMPGTRGPQLVAALHEGYPDAKILVLTMVDNPMDVHLCLSVGAKGYMLKEAAASDLIDAIRRVAAGEEYLQPSLGAVVTRGVDGGKPTGGEVGPLSDRERDVLRLLAVGHTNSEIGQLLGIAQRTVESHRTHILRKLGIRSRAELVRYAVEAGIVRLSGLQGELFPTNLEP
jgi:two-component system, NarL family, response regulator NreC